MLVKIATAVALAGISATVAVAATNDDADEMPATATATSPEAGLRARNDAATPSAIAPADVSPAAMVDPVAHALAPAHHEDSTKAFFEALGSCLDALPEGSMEGVPRLEVDMYVRALDGAPYVEHVDVTSGRKTICADGVDEPTPIDAPGVRRHDELAACMAYSMDTFRLPLPEHDEGGVRGVVVMLDGHGRMAESKREPMPLPDVSDETIPDPRTAVAALDLPQRGADDDAAQIRIVECGSYECPFCRRGEATLRELGERYEGLSTAWLHFPLGPSAVASNLAAVAADRQGRFWDMHTALMEHEKPMTRDDLVAVAGELGLDLARFEADLDDPATAREVARQRQVCTAAGAYATPTFFVNGDLVRGERGVDGLGEIIDELLADAAP